MQLFRDISDSLQQQAFYINNVLLSFMSQVSSPVGQLRDLQNWQIQTP